MISFGDKQDQVFLGKELSRAQNYSEETAQKIDSEIKNIIDTQYSRAMEILNDKIDGLHTTAAALLEYETIEGKHVHEILEHGKITSEITHDRAEDESQTEEEIAEDAKPTAQEKDNEEIDPGAEPLASPAW